MKELVAQAMREGALGLSSSLQYVPDRFASTDELVELAKVAASYGGIYITHQRSESGKIFESLDEVFAIAERAKIPAEIFHLKTAYQANFGKMPEVLARIHAARARGLDITANQYPYTRAANGLDACLPLWVREGGMDKMIARLKDPAQREKARNDMADATVDDLGKPVVRVRRRRRRDAGGGDRIPSCASTRARRSAEIGRLLNKDPRDVVMDFVIADRAQSGVIISIMTEEDVRLALADPLVSVGTDAGARAEDGPLSESRSHPRAWGSFPRILGHYVRDEHVLTLEEAVRKMTSRAAIRVGLTDRGLLRPGMFADITIFDPATIRDVATFEDPTHYSVGIRWVARQRPRGRRRRPHHHRAAGPVLARPGRPQARGTRTRPASSMRNAEVIRQWQILREIESRRVGVTIHELATTVKVSTRTIRRDLQALQEAGFSIYDEGEENETKRWRLDAQPFRAVQEGLSVADVAALYLSRSIATALSGWPLADELGAALAKIERALNPRMREFLVDAAAGDLDEEARRARARNPAG